jgi:NAD(P)H-hydrate repair Nnr-like enzyme with NAD(P)H-hydrate epimerase domain
MTSLFVDGIQTASNPVVEVDVPSGSHTKVHNANPRGANDEEKGDNNMGVV